MLLESLASGHLGRSFGCVSQFQIVWCALQMAKLHCPNFSKKDKQWNF